MIVPVDHPLDDLAVYALDGLDAAERRHVEGHLTGCERCRTELAAHRDTLANLVVEESPPAHLWVRIAGSLDRGSERSQAAEPPAPRAGRARQFRPGAVALAAAAAAVIVLVTFTLSRSPGDSAGSVEDLAAAALTDPVSRVGSLQDPAGDDVARVVTEDDVGYVFLDTLPALEAGTVYQLWHLDGTGPVSLGVTARDGGVIAVALPPGARRLALTLEADGGVTAPTGPVVARGTLPAPA